MSLSDGMPTMTMPVTPANGGGNGFGFGGDGAWFLIILFLFAFCGWGGNGWGNNGNSGGVVDGYVLSSDFANIERKMDLINGGLCDGFYAVNTTLLNGFAGVNQNMNNGFQTAELSRANQQAALMQQLNAMQMQAAECCCNTQRSIEGVRYDMAAQACDTRNTVQNATRDIVENQNANSRAILDFLTNSKMRDLESANQELRLAASQSAQNNYLISQLRPCPSPAYITCNPWAGSGYGGCGSGCGC
uniref:Uncharacterized protein n=1 Tax=Siphoviridae sp. ctRPk8 TaxID=2827870 RepID=A0A8S5SIR5_9CAUD|nr:MAG TPA: hypothetical protein [Siphoviridae sp. ctRPk8]